MTGFAAAPGGHLFAGGKWNHYRSVRVGFASFQFKLTIYFWIISHFVAWSSMPSSAGVPGIDAFTRHGAGVRAVGMGKAATSIPMGAGSFYWNPAGLGLIEGTEITSLFSQPYTEVDDLQYHTVGFAHRNTTRHVIRIK